MLHVRASRIPLALACPASLEEPEIPLVGDDAAARLGTAAHLCLAATVEGRTYDLHTVAQDQGVEADELGFLVAMGRRLWEVHGKHFPKPSTERELRFIDQEITLTGHADVVSEIGGEVRIGDWKTGRLDNSADDQLRAYALLGLFQSEGEQFDSAYTMVLRVRDQVVDGERFSRGEVLAWWQRTAAKLKQTDHYNPGRHCGYCPRQATCPAYLNYLRQAVEILEVAATYVEPELLKGVVPDGQTAAKFYDALKTVEKWLEPAKEVIWAAVQANGGKLLTGDGRALTISESVTKKIDPALGLPVLRQELGETALIGCMSIAKGKVEDAIKATVGRGQKTKAIVALFEKLEAAGALIPTPIQRLEMRRLGPSSINQGEDDVSGPTIEIGTADRRPAIAGAAATAE